MGEVYRAHDTRLDRLVGGLSGTLPLLFQMGRQKQTSGFAVIQGAPGSKRYFHSRIGLKLFGFIAESVFTFIPEH